MLAIINLVVTALFGAVADFFFKDLQARKAEAEIVEATLAKAASVSQEATAQINKDMADAQVLAPSNRTELSKRLRADAAKADLAIPSH